MAKLRDHHFEEFFHVRASGTAFQTLDYSLPVEFEAMSKSFLRFCLIFLIVATCVRESHAEAALAGPLIKYLTSVVEWTKSAASESILSDENMLQFEDGYLVETVVEGNALGVMPYSIRISQDGELFAVDAEKNNIVRITPPLSQYSKSRLVAGSFQGNIGHIDGKPSDACFHAPRGVTMDDKGNVYVADTANLAIRKIGETGVTTIAGGKSNIAGYRDGPSEDAQFSADFDVVYIRPTCSLLVIDRGNAALRQISLNQEDCDFNSSSISVTDFVMVIGAILVGYILCLFQQGLSPSFLPSMSPHDKLKSSETGFQEEPRKEKPTPVVKSVKEEEPVAGCPSFGQLIVDLAKSALETASNIFLQLVPSRIRQDNPKNDLTATKDKQAQSQPAKKQRATDTKPLKMRSASLKDPSKHRSSKRQEYGEFYGSAEGVAQSSQARSKSQKEKVKHRHHKEKSGEVGFRAFGQVPKPVETRTVNYEDPRFDPYKIRAKYGSDNSYRL